MTERRQRLQRLLSDAGRPRWCLWYHSMSTIRTWQQRPTSITPTPLTSCRPLLQARTASRWMRAGGRVPVGRRAAPSPLSWRVSSRRRLVSALCAAAAVQSISTHRDCPQPSVLARWRFGRPTQWKHWELRRFGDCKSGTVLRRTELMVAEEWTSFGKRFTGLRSHISSVRSGTKRFLSNARLLSNPQNLNINKKYKLLCPRGTQTCALAVANIAHAVYLLDVAKRPIPQG